MMQLKNNSQFPRIPRQLSVTATLLVSTVFLNSCSISLFDDLSLDSVQRQNSIVIDAVEANPQNHHAWFMMGREKINIGDTEGAVDAFEQAIELMPDYEEAWVGIGYAHLRLEEWTDAAEAFEQLLELKPGAPEGIEGLAIALFEQGEMKRSRALSLQALAIDDELYRAHQVLGHIYYADLNYEKAEEHWQKALLYGAPASDLEPVFQDLRLYRQKYQ